MLHFVVARATTSRMVHPIACDGRFLSLTVAGRYFHEGQDTEWFITGYGHGTAECSQRPQATDVRYCWISHEAAGRGVPRQRVNICCVPFLGSESPIKVGNQKKDQHHEELDLRPIVSCGAGMRLHSLCGSVPAGRPGRPKLLISATRHPCAARRRPHTHGLLR